MRQALHMQVQGVRTGRCRPAGNLHHWHQAVCLPGQPADTAATDRGTGGASMTAGAAFALERLPQVMARVGLSRSEIYRRIAAGDFPQPVKLGERASAWNAAGVDRSEEHTSELPSLMRIPYA